VQTRPKRILAPLAAILVSFAIAITSPPASAAAWAYGAAPRGESPVRPASAGQPTTVSGTVSVDLSRVLPGRGVERLRGDAVRTTATVTSTPLRICPGFWFTAFGVVWR
jgi:hypothetical protein